MVANTDTKATSTFLSSDKMNLPENLFHSIDTWTKEDVEKWIEYCINEYSIGDINVNAFKMNGKALLLLNEDGFKQRSIRSGDILYQALQQHNALIKSLNCPTFPFQLWNQFPLFRHFNIPLPFLPPPLLPPPPSSSSLNYLHSAFNYPINRPDLQTSNKINNQLLVKQDCTDEEDIDIEVSTPPITLNSELFPRTKPQTNNDSRQIRYYHDRIDFHGDILMKPQGAKNCRILWEFIYILLEDPEYASIIHWENREKMIFRIIQADKLAALWGLQKNRLSMTYEKLSRGMRYYYSNNIIAKEQSRRLLYRFLRSPDEIRKSMKRNTNSTNMIYPKSSFSIPTINNEESSSSPYLKLFSNLNPLFPIRNNSISKSDRSSSSSPESLDSSHDSEKQYCSPSQSSSSSTSTKRKQAMPLSLTTRLSQFEQPLNLAIPKEEEEKYINYKKQKFIYNSSSI